MTQEQFGLALGVSRRAVIYLEQGLREPSYGTVEKFKRLVKVHGGGNVGA